MRLNDKNSLASLIRARLDERFVVVARPEHPYLDEPPDLLIGGEGLLTAIFSPNARERRAPRLLRARLIAARLALPDNTRCVFLQPEEVLKVRDVRDQDSTEAQDVEKYAKQEFDVTISVLDTAALVDAARDDTLRVRRQSELSEQRFLAARKSAIALTLSQIARRKDSNSRIFDAQRITAESPIKSVLSQLASPGTPFRPGISGVGAWPRHARMQPYHRGDQMLMWATADRGLSLAIRTSLLNEFILDAGVPYATSKSVPIVFLEQGIELLSLETTAAASLAGLAIGPANNPGLVEKFIELTDVAKSRRLTRADLTDWLGD